jgi:hypothetical protein
MNRTLTPYWVSSRYLKMDWATNKFIPLIQDGAYVLAIILASEAGLCLSGGCDVLLGGMTESPYPLE